ACTDRPWRRAELTRCSDSPGPRTLVNMEVVGFSGEIGLPVYQRAFRRLGSPRPIYRWAYTIGSAPLVLGFLFYGVTRPDDGLLVGGLALLLIAGLVWGAPEVSAYLVSRRNGPEQLSGSATSDGLSVSSRRSTFEASWTVFSQVKRTKGLLVLV